MTIVASRGLLRAATALAGDDVDAVCRTFEQWQRRGDRELPWLAGPAFSALGIVSIPPPERPELRVLERFLLAAPVDAADVRAALARCAQDVDVPPVQPPDARGALVGAVEQFFDRLAEVYDRLHAPVRDGHRRYVEEAIAGAEDDLDAAAADVRERALVLRGGSNQPARRPRRVPERAGCALAFVAASLLTALVVVWLVLQGWPMSPVPFDL